MIGNTSGSPLVMSGESSHSTSHRWRSTVTQSEIVSHPEIFDNDPVTRGCFDLGENVQVRVIEHMENRRSERLQPGWRLCHSLHVHDSCPGRRGAWKDGEQGATPETGHTARVPTGPIENSTVDVTDGKPNGPNARRQRACGDAVDHPRSHAGETADRKTTEDRAAKLDAPQSRIG